MKQDLNHLIDISRFYGRDKRAVIAGGGNTSMKTADRIWVKASGHALADIDESGFAVLDRKKLGVISGKKYSHDPFRREREIKLDLEAACLTQGLRPSVETSLHDLIGYKYVVHLHPTLLNGLLCASAVTDYLPGIFGDAVLYIPYTDPGYILFKTIEKELAGYRRKHATDPAVILIRNHGVFVGAESTGEVRKIYDGIFEKIKVLAGDMPPTGEITVSPVVTEILPHLRMKLSREGLKALRIRNNELIKHFCASEKNFKKISQPFTPDIVVYCKAHYLYLGQKSSAGEWQAETDRKLDAFRKEHGFDPRVILLGGTGLVAAGDNAAEAETILDVFEDEMQIAWISERFGGPHPLDREQVQFIDTWEVENYRRTVLSAGKGQSIADRRTVIVTGAAMGFGAGVARELFEKGANLVLADINSTEGEKTLETLNSLGRKNQAVFVRTDVSNPAHFENLAFESVKAFGAVDCFISNAGILKAGGLDEMDEETFDLVTRINYNAYFYGTKAISRIMKVQQQACRGMAEKDGGVLSGYFCDIIQINSKSGLSGSRMNFAYAGGKFGGIGLTQSFALELAPDRIKVNSVCPGNFFEGPLWSDPVNGLFVQYLRAGKVPGARSVDDVRKYYESQVPLGRGCRPGDIMKAILYLMEQEYETGQALPVTGGQIMLR